jgi:hypothetical protein
MTGTGSRLNSVIKPISPSSNDKQNGGSIDRGTKRLNSGKLSVKLVDPA